MSSNFELKSAFLVSRDRKTPKFGICEFDLRLPDKAQGVTTPVLFYGEDMVAVMSQLVIGKSYNVLGEIGRSHYEGERRDGGRYEIKDGKVFKARAVHEANSYGAKPPINK